MKIIEFEVDTSQLANGIEQIANLSRLRVCQENEELFENLDFDNERAFLEPELLFRQAQEQDGDHSPHLEQLMWGFLIDKEHPAQVSVRTCAEGWVKLPNLGNLKTELPSASITLVWNGADSFAAFALNGKQVAVVFHPEITFPSSTLRLTRNRPDVYRKLGVHLNEDITSTFTKWSPALTAAFAIMKQVAPDYCQLIEDSCQEVSMFSSDNQNSFASREHFGTCFINVDDQDSDEVFFLDELAHQCGHNIFNGLTLTVDDYLIAAPDTPLNALQDNAMSGEHRTLYGALHGLFTYNSIIYCLDRAVQQRLFKEEQIRDAIGRIGFYMRKFNHDLKQLNISDIFTPKGQSYYNVFQKCYDTILNKYKVLPPVSYSTQPYTFRLKLFISENLHYAYLNEESLLEYGL